MLCFFKWIIIHLGYAKESIAFILDLFDVQNTQLTQRILNIWDGYPAAVRTARLAAHFI